VARLGGDEFVLILPLANSASAPLAAQKIHKLFEQPVLVQNTPLQIEVAIGIALYPQHGDTADILLQHADIAMRLAKSEAGGYSIYDPADDPYSLRKLRLYGELREAIKGDALTLFYQPKIDLGTGKVSSVEALARWPHPTEGIIPPNDFIPMIEQSGLIRPFTQWLLDEALRQCKAWRERGIELAVAINLSTRNLLDPQLADNIEALLRTHCVTAACLVLEITETTIMSRPEMSLKVLTRLHKMGVALSIDDFGTGYSSLSYLKKLPVNELKIDASFVLGIPGNDNDLIIVRSIIQLAKNMGLRVVAEGVENNAILQQLVRLDCDTAQGYYFSHPLPATVLEGWLVNRET
jgi:EAL domain-containing protein (putative c-di-GMP-specific phosphodiesterase class I)